MSFTTIRTSTSMIASTSTNNLGPPASSGKDSWNSVSTIRCSYPGKSLHCSNNSKGLTRDCKAIPRSLFWGFGSLNRRYLSRLTAMTFKDDGRDGSETRYDLESFSKLLVEVPYSEIKFFSKLAFLCNMSYVILHLKAIHLRRHYGLHFVTSSLKTKAEETSGTEAKLEEIGSENVIDSEQENHRIGSSKDLMSMAGLHSSRFEWFICDDPTRHTRIIVVQGPNSLKSWWPILSFEPTKFEGKPSVFVHKGIYEAAKVIYKTVIPYVEDFLQTHGEHARFQLTGHSMGGSIAVLVSLMMLSRNVVRSSSMVHPVVTFGSPFVLRGGRKLLDELMLDDAQIKNVIMNRDIVPRGFSCNYPAFLISILKLFNSSVHSPPINGNKFLYPPLGKLFVLQPKENSLLPRGTHLYALDDTKCGNSSSNAVINGFLNYPHPLQALFDLNAYGDEGTVLLNHDSSSYLKAIICALRIQRDRDPRPIEKKSLFWPLLDSPSPRSRHP